MLNALESLPFHEKFEPIIDKNDLSLTQEFFSVPGKEHYKLLAYLSTKFVNSIIIDIGTHQGYSALALSYNLTNTIHTFDIVNKNIHPNIRNACNIEFHLDDLFSEEGFAKWKSTLLASPMIFLDVDPHNGVMEYWLVMKLKENNYSGYIICDDIWYFKEMRNNFWYKIEEKFRYDLTETGHWSGTGLIYFGEDNELISILGLELGLGAGLYTNNEWTLVTAYFNLTEFADASQEIIERDQNYYFSHALSTLSLPYNLVIYCDQGSLEIIKGLRPAYLQDKTCYIVKEFNLLQFKKENSYLKETFADYRNKILENRKTVPSRDNRNTASYYLFCMSRYLMLKETIETNPFKSTHFAWINFCIERMGYKNLIYLNRALSIGREKFSTCYIEYQPPELVNNLPEYFQFGRCGMCSGFFTGKDSYMYQVCDLIENKFLEFLEKGYGHADEQLYSAVYFDHPELFKHYYGDYQQMITNYCYVHEAPEAPISNFIQNSFKHGNYEKCYEACKFVLNSHLLNKCTISNGWLTKLTNYYMQSKLFLKDIDNDIYENV